MILCSLVQQGIAQMCRFAFILIATAFASMNVAMAEPAIDVTTAAALCERHAPSETKACEEDVRQLADAAGEFRRSGGTSRALPAYREYLSQLRELMRKYPIGVVTGLDWISAENI